MKIRGLLVSAFAMSFLACNSPLFEHANAGDLGAGDEKSRHTSSCPLSFPQHGLCAELAWDQTPNDQDAAGFRLTFWKADEATESGPYTTPIDTVAVKLWMPAHGHGSAPVTLVQERDAGGQAIPGVFTGSNVYFVMPGTWQVKVQLKQGSTLIEEANLDVQI